MPKSVNAMEFAGKEALLEALRADRATFYDLVGGSEAAWTAQTPCERWQVRDLVGHMIDNGEAYLERFGLARAGKPAPAPLGLVGMADKEDQGARRFREVPRAQLLERLRRGSDELFALFERLSESQWPGEMVPHTYMGPLPAFFYPVFQLMDYSVHTWDAQQALGIKRPLSNASAVILVPFMFILWQYTVDQQRAANLKLRCGIKVAGEHGGSWAVTVDHGVFSHQPQGVESCPATIEFDPSDFVLTAFQRIQGGQDSGDRQTAQTFRGLFFRI